ncbi:MAG: hypothetical protein PVJ92_02905, partial [Candidatus Dependentiae bacterium]
AAIDVFVPERFAALATIADNEDVRAHQIARVVVQQAWSISSVRARWQEEAGDDLKKQAVNHTEGHFEDDLMAFDHEYSFAVSLAKRYRAESDAKKDLQDNPRTLAELLAAAYAAPMHDKAQIWFDVLSKEYFQLSYQLPRATDEELSAFSTQDIDTVVALSNAAQPLGINYGTIFLRLIVDTQQSVLEHFSPSAIEHLAVYTLSSDDFRSLNLSKCLKIHAKIFRYGGPLGRCIRMVREVNLLEEFDARATDEIRATYTEKTKKSLAKIKERYTTKQVAPDDGDLHTLCLQKSYRAA